MFYIPLYENIVKAFRAVEMQEVWQEVVQKVKCCVRKVQM